MNPKSSTIEKTYQKKSQLEHILLRPDTYIGSVESTTQSLWILDESSSSSPRFINKTIEYIPGIYKIFDEIIVNAADNFQRDRRMNTIKVTIDAKNSEISVWNNGKGIPIEIHKAHNIYVPELIFGHLLTSSNYDDTEKKVTGGRNGYGAKLTNIFSTRFTVSTGDAKAQKSFEMTWTNNMSSSSKPNIQSYSGEDFTCVKFQPDLARFGVKTLENDMISLLKKRVYDLAGVLSSRIKVFLNNKKIESTGFTNYVDLYLNSEEKTQEKICETGKNTHERWEVIASVSDGHFQQVSFVNGICTSRGGTHVSYICDQIIDRLMEIIKKKHKDLHIKPFQIKGFLFLFVNCLIENPAFDSQTKETLTTKPSNFGSSYEVSEKFLKDLLKTNVLDLIISQAKAKEHAKVAKTLTAQKKSRLLGIPKLEDANDAGTKHSEHCTLILTEGDSAKSLAMVGLEVVGRDRFGVFPLKGKLLNVRDVSHKQCSENQELQHLIKILGLQFGKKYDSNNVRTLRYGSVMVMADQDHDGSHIKGLVINFFHAFWPELLRVHGFLKEFVTPIVKVARKNEVKSFFTITDFKKWEQGVSSSVRSQWSTKYYKGLGTSTSREGKEYFEKIQLHTINFVYSDSKDDEAINLAFNKKLSNERKDWLLALDPENTVDHARKSLSFSDFIHKELIFFSYMDNLRAIPSVCDGLKPSQRKILFACFKRNLRTELKVAQLAGYVSEHSAYHHGEASLCGTIVDMAQNYVGSNNINLLEPIGQFGTRSMGGKDSASARYIYTNLSKITRKIFVEHDDSLLNYCLEEGQSVEPRWYLPVIPMILVNGAVGIGTGWSTSIPCYNPREIAEIFLKKLQNTTNFEFPDSLTPWFRGFRGEIYENEKNNGFVVSGLLEKIDENTVEIRELPIGRWTRDYKNFLEEKLEDENWGIEDIKEFHSEGSVHFVIKFKENRLKDVEKRESLEKAFKLSTSLSVTNLVLYDSCGKLKKYSGIREILQEFFEVRREFYEKRKAFLAEKTEKELEFARNKLRFIKEILDNSLKLANSRKSEIISQLIARNYKGFPRKAEKSQENSENIEDFAENSRDFDYLLGMPLFSLSFEKVQSLEEEVAKLEEALFSIKSRSIEEFWSQDLSEFLEFYAEEFEKREIVKENSRKIVRNVKEFLAKPKKKTKKNKEMEEEDEDFECELRENVKKNENFEEKLRKREKSSIIIEEDAEESLPKPEKLPKLTEKTQKNCEKPEKPVEKAQKIPEKPEKNTEKDKENRFSLNSSILKYLVPRNLASSEPKNLKNSTNTEKNSGFLSLQERLLLRETQGNVKSFEEAYKKDAETPLKEFLSEKAGEMQEKKEILLDFHEKNQGFMQKSGDIIRDTFEISSESSEKHKKTAKKAEKIEKITKKERVCAGAKRKFKESSNESEEDASFQELLELSPKKKLRVSEEKEMVVRERPMRSAAKNRKIVVEDEEEEYY